MQHAHRVETESCVVPRPWAGAASDGCLSFFSFVPVVFEEPEDPSNRSFFSEIISSVSDVKFSHSGRYMLTRDYLTVKVWDLNMEARPIETYQVSPSAGGSPQTPFPMPRTPVEGLSHVGGLSGAHVVGEDTEAQEMKPT